MTENFDLLLMTILPSCFLLIFFVKSDKFREPASSILKIFLLGILICLPAGYLNIFVIQDFEEQAYLAGFTEETLKFLFFIFYINNHKHYDEPMDGIVYGVCLSLGFATLENFEYVFFNTQNVYDSYITAALRSFSAIPLHCFCGVIMGFYFSDYKFNNNKKSLFLSLLIPIAFHSLYNFLVSIQSILYLILLAYLIIFSMNLLKKYKLLQSEVDD